MSSRPSSSSSSSSLSMFLFPLWHFPLLHLVPFLIFFASFLIKESSTVRVVALHVPSSVRKGAEVELACLYELDNSSLYSLKWFYRTNETDLDEQEFFRYTPTLLPHKQYFPIEGINVNVNKSEGGRVVIVEPTGKTSGKYKCEISIEGTFQTVAAEKLMTVMDFWDFYLPAMSNAGTSAATSMLHTTSNGCWVLGLLLSCLLNMSNTGNWLTMRHRRMRAIFTSTFR